MKCNSKKLLVLRQLHKSKVIFQVNYCHFVHTIRPWHQLITNIHKSIKLKASFSCIWHLKYLKMFWDIQITNDSCKIKPDAMFVAQMFISSFLFWSLKYQFLQITEWRTNFSQSAKFAFKNFYFKHCIKWVYIKINLAIWHVPPN